jgi:hypothetical protein
MDASREARDVAMEKHASLDTSGKRLSGSGGVAETQLQASPDKEKANPHKGIKLVPQICACEQALL